jgi:hypothetical protein
MVFNQNWVPGWNAIYSNLLMKVSKTIITANVYTSPFTSMVQDMETGQYVEDIHINPSQILLQDTITNSDIFTDYTDDLAVAIYEVGVDLVYPSTYTEYVVKTSFTLIDNVSELISALTANIRTTLEFHRNNLVKQMLFNAYKFGMISSKKIKDPRSSQQASGQFAVSLNTTVDDFRTEINPRNVIYNNQIGITPEKKRQTISTEHPYIIIFNEYIRDVEFMNALNLGMIEKFRSGNSNMDFQNRIITLNLDDFPTAIPPVNRSAVTGSNVSAKDINFYEMPTDNEGEPLFSGVPTGGKNVCAFIIDPQVIKLFTQLSITTAWLNPASLRNTNREIYRGIMNLGAFNKICAVTFDDIAPAK